jgi:2-methylcitrate dehydratase PrpD
MAYLADKLADYIVNFDFDRIPPEVAQHAKYLLLDSVGVSIASCDRVWCNAVLEVIRHQGGRAESTVLYYGDRVPDTNAALANATFAHSMDFNDDLAGIQVGGIIPPTVFAVGEAVGASGRDLIAATVLGYDMATRIAAGFDSQGLYMRGLQPTAIVGGFVAAAIAAKLLRLDAGQVANALGLAGSYAGGTIEFLKEGTDTKRFHVAKAAHGGVLCSRLARGGMTGPRSIFEGEFGVFKAYSDAPRLDMVLEELGSRWDILDSSVKRYPFCDGNAAPLEAAFGLVQEAKVDVDDIERLHFRMKSFLIPYVVDYHGDRERKYRPQTELDAQMSLPYCVATGLLNNGKVTLADFERARLADPRVLALGEKMSAEGHAPFDKIPLRPMSMPAIVELTTRDGRKLSKQVDYQKGDPRNPFTREDFVNKFNACANGRLDPAKQEQAVAAILGLEAQPNLSTLMGFLARP